MAILDTEGNLKSLVYCAFPLDAGLGKPKLLLYNRICSEVLFLLNLTTNDNIFTVTARLYFYHVTVFKPHQITP